MILTEKRQKYQLYRLEKLKNLIGEEIIAILSEQNNRTSKVLDIPLSLKHLKKKQKHLKSKGKNKQMILQIKTKDQRLDSIKMIIKVSIKKYLIKQLNKNLMK